MSMIRMLLKVGRRGCEFSRLRSIWVLYRMSIWKAMILGVLLDYVYSRCMLVDNLS